MQDEFAIQEFYSLTQRSDMLERESYSISPESANQDVLEFIFNHLERKNDFCNAFIKIIKNPDLGSVELVQYCMHVL